MNMSYNLCFTYLWYVIGYACRTSYHAVLELLLKLVLIGMILKKVVYQFQDVSSGIV